MLPTYALALEKLPTSDMTFAQALESCKYFNIPENRVKIQFPGPEKPYAGQHFSQDYSLRFGRENNIPMMQPTSILRYNAAKHLGETGLKAMQERGRMQTGIVADIVVFAPEVGSHFEPISQAALNAKFSTAMSEVVLAFPFNGRN